MSVGRVRAAPSTEAPPAKRGNAAKIALAAAVVLVAIGGGSLTLVPSIGPFGANFISDQLNAKAYAQSLVELRAHVDAGFDEDTSAGATRAVEEAKQAQAARPRHKPTTAFAAYAALARSLRFGKRGDDEATRSSSSPRRPDGGGHGRSRPRRRLAVAGNSARARPPPRRSPLPHDVDAAALAGEIELAAKPKDALGAWKQARSA